MTRLFAFLVILAAGGAATGAQGQDAPADSLLVSEIVAAESTVDSLRAEIRKLDREIQVMKQDYVDSGDVARLLDAFAGEEPDPEAPDDTRSRRQRVDTLLRAISQRPGQLRFNGGATMIAQALVGGDPEGSAGTGSFDLFAHTSFGPRTLLFFAFEAGGGEGLDAVLPLVTPINGDAAPTRGREDFEQLALNEAWAEFTAFEEAVTLTAGKLDLTNYFDINLVANDETAQFLSGAFVNGAALLAPTPGPGFRARTVLFGRLSVQAGITSADSTGGTRFRDAFTIGEIGMRLFPESFRDGNLRAYLYAPAHVGGATGWGLSADQRIPAGFTVFGRWGSNGRGLLEEGGIRQAWSAGGQWEEPVHGRLAAGAAVGEAREADGSRETNFETYLSWQLNTWTFVSPHLQIARHHDGMAKASSLLGLRVQFNF